MVQPTAELYDSIHVGYVEQAQAETIVFGYRETFQRDRPWPQSLDSYCQHLKAQFSHAMR